MEKYDVVVIGGGTGGIMVAAQLLRARKSLQVAIIEPSETHHYQPAWTLVGAGLMSKKATERREKRQIPKGANWIKDRVADIIPESNQVILQSGEAVTYEFLVVAAGIQMNLHAIEGLKEAMGNDEVCSNYIDPEYTWQVLRGLKGGKALFTQPTGPLKCPGAPQKIMYLAADYFERENRDVQVSFITPGTVIFGTEPFKTELERYLEKYDIPHRFGYKLVKIDGDRKEAHYERIQLPNDREDHIHNDHGNRAGGMMYHTAQPEIRTAESNGMASKLPEGTRFVFKYDMLHVAPPQSAPGWFQKTALANPDGPNAGWMAVYEHTLQSRMFANVFGVGDITDLPTARTGAAIRKQAPVIVDNLLRVMDGQKADMEGYDGYSSCPLVVAHNRMLLAEFKYGNERSSDPLLSKFLNTGKASYPMWLMKRYGLPFLYWNAMLKGYRF